MFSLIEKKCKINRQSNFTQYKFVVHMRNVHVNICNVIKIL